MTLKTSTLPGVSLADATWVEETKSGFRDWKTVGRGACSAHHGEILQGMFEDNGKLHRALISVPFGHLTSAAKFQPDETINTIVVEPGNCVKARAAAELTLRKCGRKHGGYLTLSSNIPERIGLGSSTADVVATIYKSLGVDLHTELPGPQGRPFPVVDTHAKAITELF